jgi:hypothetical protein
MLMLRVRIVLSRGGVMTVRQIMMWRLLDVWSSGDAVTWTKPLRQYRFSEAKQ